MQTEIFVIFELIELTPIIFVPLLYQQAGCSFRGHSGVSLVTFLLQYHALHPVGS